MDKSRSESTPISDIAMKLIWARELTKAGQSLRGLSRDHASGKIVRIRHGIYLPRPLWMSLAPQQQYELRLHIVAAAFSTEPVFADLSAAVLWGIPVIGVPNKVHILAGRNGGGRSKNGVARHCVIPGSVPITRLGRWLVTDKVATGIRLATTLSFPQAVAAVDRLLNCRPLDGEDAWAWPVVPTKADLMAYADTLGSAAKMLRARAIIEFADGRSGSVGESVSRANMYLEGFPVPELQYKVVDADGLIGYSDFYWPTIRLLGEFDGVVKYTRNCYLKGKTAGEIVTAEKFREDRMRATGLGMTRWLWDVGLDRNRLRIHLERAGLTSLRLPQR